ncbi:MAG TPA: 1-(5-phosphoribosyl)-5-((5-phosphoribosylamino)methylideneamino)imidazole-4-carboxamide isomerase [Gammaproteobacteria bacterium]|nr:1-(5-phosphoribosyl)-5-((5-phosphoribosylamino)methylideneamino)imidazole-4-carboxamide isomerase [Gammaproteobacteria bacterium]HAE04853.1 1-(5-phosphoribosyl)-5-((5-phosphoribosylamino)methylideneamino)imidazole-4-carboxamide isomerase [Gammaproteobacteria bacterium]HAE70092.1 1-(5-phosphoribosyl)-5-((5-phosphoribosylamino)methylideneamino)imidazole-4-carboxamide isomerase [Gammaproteobacteria bacterium]HAE72767.1 1-(5-phosphoribosyl)-5-((5-phosphoribosylamino)methylideneamino)imidazole-4-c
MITPSNIILNKGKTLFTITFDGVDYPLTTEYLRVYSPSAEVVGHGPGQETLQVDKSGVTITRIEPTGNYAVILFFSDGHDSGIYSWSHLHHLATNHKDLWPEYLARLKAAGHSHPEL